MFKDRLQEILEFTKSESPYRKANKGWINQDIFLEFGKSSSALSKQKESAKLTLLWPPIQRLISNLLIIVIISSLIVITAIKGSQLNFNLASLSVAFKDKLVQIDTKKSNIILGENQMIDINFNSKSEEDFPTDINMNMSIHKSIQLNIDGIPFRNSHNIGRGTFSKVYKLINRPRYANY